MHMNALNYKKRGYFSPSKQGDFLKRIDPQLVMHEEMEEALSTVSDYITHFVTHLKSGSGMIWMGRQKTAKSMLAIYLAHALMEVGFSFRQELNLDFLSTLSQSSEVLEDNYPYAEHSQLLLIDDGGQFAFSLTDKQKKALKQIIHVRRRKALPLIWMTQFSQESLPRFLGDSIAQDLLRPRNRIVHFDWDHSYILTERVPC